MSLVNQVAPNIIGDMMNCDIQNLRLIYKKFYFRKYLY